MAPIIVNGGNIPRPPAPLKLKRTQFFTTKPSPSPKVPEFQKQAKPEPSPHLYEEWLSPSQRKAQRKKEARRALRYKRSELPDTDPIKQAQAAAKIKRDIQKAKRYSSDLRQDRAKGPVDPRRQQRIDRLLQGAEDQQLRPIVRQVAKDFKKLRPDPIEHSIRVAKARRHLHNAHKRSN